MQRGWAITGIETASITPSIMLRSLIRETQTLCPDVGAATELEALRPDRRGGAAGKLPVVLFTAGGIASPADAATMMHLAGW